MIECMRLIIGEVGTRDMALAWFRNDGGVELNPAGEDFPIAVYSSEKGLIFAWKASSARCFRRRANISALSSDKLDAAAHAAADGTVDGHSTPE